ncbi:hypothetical protein ACP70R_023107 [Stipagrostis hirtigluma subsp. patula]
MMAGDISAPYKSRPWDDTGSIPPAFSSSSTISSQHQHHRGHSFLRPCHPVFVTRLVCRCSSKGIAPEMEAGFTAPGWGDFFINYTPPQLQAAADQLWLQYCSMTVAMRAWRDCDPLSSYLIPGNIASMEWMIERTNELKEDVNGLFEACEDVVEKMNLVDVVQRLGIDHHFKEQITTMLCSIQSADFNSTNLHDVALRFRLLRQQGVWVSPELFNIFRNEDGCFISDIAGDPKGLLSLYNAANLLTHNETILEEAISFARNHQELMRGTLKSPLAEQVSRSLQIPLPRTLKRVEATNYILEYNIQEPTYNPSILELAKLDINLHQHLYQKELKAISEWWQDLSRDIELEYVRDRVVECYFCSYAVFHEQEHTRARLILTKLFMLWSILDDTYDVRATLDEGQKLNEAIQRMIWDNSAVSLLPEYLRKFFLNVLSIFNEFEDELGAHEKYKGAYITKAYQTASRCYLQESGWFHQNYIPPIKEKADVSAITGGSQIVSVGLLFCMGDVATKEAFEWAIGCADAVRAIGEIGRYMNDMAAHKNGKNKMDTASFVECYIKEHNATSEVALANTSAMVESAWKTINQAWFEHDTLLPVMQRFSNYAMCLMLYLNEKRNAYTNNKDLKGMIKTHFVDPIPL